jgi:hypothetical protein
LCLLVQLCLDNSEKGVGGFNLSGWNSILLLREASHQDDLVPSGPSPENPLTVRFEFEVPGALHDFIEFSVPWWPLLCRLGDPSEHLLSIFLYEVGEKLVNLARPIELAVRQHIVGTALAKQLQRQVKSCLKRKQYGKVG